MKDAKGHGSNARGGGEMQQAAQNFQAAHQAGVNEAAPSQTGRELYDAAVNEARGQPGYNLASMYDEKALQQIQPDFDETPGVGSDPYYPRGYRS